MAKRRSKSRSRREAVTIYTKAERAENRLCSPKCGVDGFRRFAATRCQVMDEKLGRPVPFVWFKGQERIAPSLVAGKWLCILKGRQLGVTTLIACYVLWLLCYRKRMKIVVVFQEKIYAEDFIDTIRMMYDHLPRTNRKKITTDNRRELIFGAGGNAGRIRAIVGSPRAARSMTGQLLIIDEASRVPFLDKTLQAALPAFEVAGGQFVSLSTSAGPQGIFYEVWKDAYGEYGEQVRPDAVTTPIFLHWSERPGRDQVWYEREKARLHKLGGGAIAMKQEHPNDPQEAWEYAEGRVYAHFERSRHVGTIEIPTTAVRYRAIDWGQTDSPMVCLWIAYLKGPSGLLISPDCPNTIREMFAYRWDEDRPNDPLKQDDHAPDALRYAVVSYRMTGLVYVYREWYVPESVQKGWSFMKEIHAIHEMTGWVKDPDTKKWQLSRTGERIKSTVADRSWPKTILEYCLHGIPTIPHIPVKGVKDITGTGKATPARADKEVLEGIKSVATLIHGEIPIEDRMPVTRELEVRGRLAEMGEDRIKVASTIQDRQIRDEARRLLARRLRRRSRGLEPL